MDLSTLAALKDMPIVYAFAIGLVTAIGPCPLSANVTAIAYVSSKFSDPSKTIMAGALYTAGRALTYSLIGLLAYMFGSAVMDSAPLVQDYEKAIMGMLLLAVGLVMLEILKPKISIGDSLKEKYGINLANKGMAGAFGLGAVFALAFCPYTAVMFFGLLMPLALRSSMLGASFPLLFGIGTGLPVFVFALLLGMSAALAKTYIKKLVKAEPYVRRGLGMIFILYGAFLLATFIF